MYLNSTITIIADYDTNMNVSDMYKMVNENGSTKKIVFANLELSTHIQKKINVNMPYYNVGYMEHWPTLKHLN